MVWKLSLLILWSSVPRRTLALDCDVEHFIDLSTNAEADISSPGYPDSLYSPGDSITWCVSAPDDVTIILNCDIFDIPKSVDCEMSFLTISSSKEQPRPFCGSKPFRTESSTNNMIVKFYSNKKSRGGKFFCNLKVQKPPKVSLRTIVYDDCECGYSYSLRIVGGKETGVNEFPFMAGIVDSRRGAIVVCGASIISEKYVLTAQHCLNILEVEYTAILVGEHNIALDSDTNATKLIKAKRFIDYPYYNTKDKRYDIAMIELMYKVTYSLRVGPVCLPFVSKDWNLTGQEVTVLGWGTTEFGGPRSKFLQKAYLRLIDISSCSEVYGSDVEPNTQLCAFGGRADACQYDSGGPLVWLNPQTSRYELVGLVSYGRGCGSSVPSVNTKVAPFLQWIIDYAPDATFCYLSY